MSVDKLNDTNRLDNENMTKKARGGCYNIILSSSWVYSNVSTIYL